MLRENNESPRQCAANLSKIIQGEVPYSRLKGVDKAIIDKPMQEAAAELAQAIKWNVEVYEPRFLVEDVTVGGVQSAEQTEQSITIDGKETGQT